MAKNSIRDYSATNSSNTDIQSIDISEGCSPAGINNAIREVMADLKDVSTGAVALESPAFDSASLTGDLTFGDGDKAIFGAGSDLQIYHDGGSSWVSDVGAGNLKLSSDGAGVFLQKGATEFMGEFLTDGAVRLYYDNAAKFETTNTGVDVTGTVTADGLTVDDGGNNTNIRLQNTNSGSGPTDGFIIQHATNAISYVWNYENADTVFGTNATERMRIKSDGNVQLNGQLHLLTLVL